MDLISQIQVHGWYEFPWQDFGWLCATNVKIEVNKLVLFFKPIRIALMKRRHLISEWHEITFSHSVQFRYSISFTKREIFCAATASKGDREMGFLCQNYASWACIMYLFGHLQACNAGATFHSGSFWIISECFRKLHDVYIVIFSIHPFGIGNLSASIWYHNMHVF